MTDYPKILLWRGQKLSEMTRDELIEAIEWLGPHYTEAISRTCPVCAWRREIALDTP